MSANSWTFWAKVCASASAAALRLRPERSCSRVQRRLDGEIFAQNLEPQIRNRRVELPVPGGVRRHRLFVKQLLDAILELIRPVAAHVFEPRPVMAERGFARRRFKQTVVDAIEFEREEQQMRGGRRHALLHVAVEFGARRIDGIAGMNEPGIGAEPPHQIVDRLVAPHRRGERGAAGRPARHFGELALVGRLEVDAFGIDAVEIALDRRIVEAGIKVVEIPLGQLAEGGFRSGRRAGRRNVWRQSFLRFSA